MPFRFAPPAILTRFARQLPTPLVSLPFAVGLELARRLKWITPPAELDGRRFAITVEDLGLRSCFYCAGGVFHPLLNGAAPELELGARLADFLALIRGDADADTLFFQRKLKVQGDTELGLIVKNWLDASERPPWLVKFAGRL